MTDPTPDDCPCCPAVPETLYVSACTDPTLMQNCMVTEIFIEGVLYRWDASREAWLDPDDKPHAIAINGIPLHPAPVRGNP